MNKNIILFSVALLFSLTTIAQENTIKTEPAKPTIQFDKDVHDYGEIEFASDGMCKFEFTNTGTEPLVLTSVKASCGCTTPQWTKDPVKPGEKGEITVKYNTRSTGTFNKSITVYSSGNSGPIILRIKGMVKPQTAAPEAKQ